MGMGMEEKARQLLARLSATPDSAVPDLPFLHRALLLPLLSSASAVLRLPLLLSSSPLCPRRRLPVPVVSVGNLTWGGNGKTPMVEFLARRFHSMGISPLLLTRGYAGGDESKMLERRLSDTSAKIGVGANRAAVATSMLEKYGYIDCCDTFRREKLSSTCNLASTESAKIGVAILDDGMQHRSLLRDLEIVMVNGLKPWGNTHLIPRGSMREPLSSLNRADILVIHHADLASEVQLETIESTVRDNSPTCPVFFSKLAPSHIFEANQPLRRLPLHVLDGMIMLCVSAIGCPDAFIHTVREHVCAVFQVLRAHSLALKRAKCFFGETLVAYLGHIISSQGVAMDPAKVTTVLVWLPPMFVRALRGFLGLIGYYRKFIKDYPMVVAPLPSY